MQPDASLHHLEQIFRAGLKRADPYQMFLDHLKLEGENLTIQFVVPGSNACAIDPANGLAPQQERRALANDPLVLTALDVFTGQVGDIRIGPRYRTTTPGSNAPIEPQIASEE